MSEDAKVRDLIRTKKAGEICSFPCRCGGTVTLATEVPSSEALVLHTMPPCDWYLDTQSQGPFLDECEKHPEAWRKFQIFMRRGAS